LLLGVGLACLGFVAVNLARDLAIWVLGRTVTAQVVETWVERIDEETEGELRFRYYVRYQFATPQGHPVTKTSSLSMEEWASLSPGDPVRVTYFVLYPEHARLEAQRYIPLFLCSYLPFTIIAWAALRGGWQMLRPPLSGPETEEPGGG
jgi:hypothetical protein